jgi:hypothetical protein
MIRWIESMMGLIESMIGRLLFSIGAAMLAR